MISLLCVVQAEIVPGMAEAMGMEHGLLLQASGFPARSTWKGLAPGAAAGGGRRQIVIRASEWLQVVASGCGILSMPVSPVHLVLQPSPELLYQPNDLGCSLGLSVPICKWTYQLTK